MLWIMQTPAGSTLELPPADAAIGPYRKCTLVDGLLYTSTHFGVDAAGQTIKVNTEELESARWFSRTELEQSPENKTFRLPRRDSIARRLLNEWLEEDSKPQ